MTGRLETQGKTVTIEAIQDPENHDPSYVAVDDIFFKADGSCETLPEGADAGPSCGDQERCNDGGCYTKEQFCDFHADCEDNTDERPCPIVYLFDDCVEMTGDPSCGWQEEPRDSLDWKLVNSSESGVCWDWMTDLHPIVTFSIFQDVGGRNGVYLWIQKDSDDFIESTARIVSPIYRNSGSNCKLRFQYYISGNMNNDYVKPSIHPVGSEMPIVMDYLTVNEEWKPHEIGIGRKRGQFQVCKYVQYYNLFLY